MEDLHVTISREELATLKEDLAEELEDRLIPERSTWPAKVLNKEPSDSRKVIFNREIDLCFVRLEYEPEQPESPDCPGDPAGICYGPIFYRVSAFDLADWWVESNLFLGSLEKAITRALEQEEREKEHDVEIERYCDDTEG